VSAPLTDLGGWKVGAEDFLAAVLQTTAQPVWVVDADGLIRFANPAAIAALGYERADELFGRPSHETIHHSHRDGTPYPAAECPMLLPRTTGETIAREVDWFFRRDGSMFPVSYVSVPLDVPEGRGAVVAFTDITERLRADRELRERDSILAGEQAALRRVAAVVAGGAGSSDVFAAVTKEVGRALGLPYVDMLHYEPDGTATVIGAWGEREHPFEVGTRWALDGPTISARVRATGAPARVDDYAEIPGAFADTVRSAGIRAAAGAPIVVDGALWGVMVTAVDSGPLPERVEQRLAGFTELVATALSHTEAHDQLRQLAEEQSALRHVATLVAEGALPAEVFAAVAAEVAQLLDLPLVEMSRYEPDGTATVIGAVGDHAFETGTNWTLDGPSLAAQVKRTGRPARVDDYAAVPGSIGDAARATGVHAGVGAPIVVDGKVWGVVSAGGGARVPLSPRAEDRLAQFTELVATAISNTQAREELQRLADEQAALRRLATLVAEGAAPGAIFDAVAEETGELLGATTVNLVHFTPAGVNVTMSGWSLRGVHVPTGTRLPIDGGSINAIVRRTARPGRCDTYEGVEGEFAAHLRGLGIRSEVGAPVVVEGQVWGALIAGTDEPQPLPVGTEHRLAEFAELIATAVANATARAELVASRARIVEAGYDQRRRVVRDLHDGAQQRFVQAIMSLQLARRRGDGDPDLARLIDESLESARAGLDELRELARGIHPAILTNHGLAAAVESLADRAPFSVEVDIPERRYPASVESAAYFVAAEALTNVAKYSRATTAKVTVAEVDGRLRLEVRDDGIGGARGSRGSGLAGLQDRVAALDGTLAVESPAGGGTRVRAEIPVRAAG
jgi:PAS domain S-box-containing protein